MTPALPVLLMTGTIAPPRDAVNLAVVDPSDRIADYATALRWYMGLVRGGTFGHLVFVENSGYGMQDFAPRVAEAGLEDRVTLVSYAGNEGANRHERLLLECRLLQHAFDTVAALRQPGLRVWKVTGRYVVRNIAAIAARTPDAVDLALHCRNLFVMRRKDWLRFVDFAVVGFKTGKTGNVLDRIVDYEWTSVLHERAVRDLLDRGAFGDLRIQPRLSPIPDYSGRRGADGASYDGPKYRLKHHARTIADRLMPNLWI